MEVRGSGTAFIGHRANSFRVQTNRHANCNHGFLFCSFRRFEPLSNADARRRKNSIHTEWKIVITRRSLLPTRPQFFFSSCTYRSLCSLRANFYFFRESIVIAFSSCQSVCFPPFTVNHPPFVCWFLQRWSVFHYERRYLLLACRIFCVI